MAVSDDKRSVSMAIFGDLLKALREGRGVTLDALAAHTGYSKSLAVKIESGERLASKAFIDKAEELLRCAGALRAVAPHLSREKLPAGYGEYADEEARAASIGFYDAHVVNGLLQTEAYMRAVFNARCPPLEEDEIDRWTEGRLARQALITRKPVCMLSFVLEEWLLRRPVGGRQVMKDQLERLLEVGKRRNVQVQVMPTRYESVAGFNGPFTFLETAERQWLAYAEGQVGGYLSDDRERVSDLYHRYGMIRAQALTPEDSAKAIEQIAGEL
ncbi:helix-turn-helix domain-containing protein [Streptomyces sp. NPDC088354]|uniref:helix-turn-helix domain-containing protein n=1 Tax=unclassified Streptomyces TaxID=2593676 RepID=UPI0029B46C69|nr:helix-turn-helix transcriptional regulator [Streptomyces sp. MI02-7b]MDX3074910.1 helix-turn-helix transcriptional regulator [Streptomyces sp. MI02-7b]